MKSILESWVGSRRRFMGWLGGLAAGGLALPWLRRRGETIERSLKEAEFYRASDWKE